MQKVLTVILEINITRRIFNRFSIFLLHSSWYGQYISLGFSLLKGMKSIMEKWRWNFLVFLENYIFGRKNLHHSILKSILSSNIWLVYITNQYFSIFWFFPVTDCSFNLFSRCHKFCQDTGVTTFLSLTIRLHTNAM